MSEPEGFLSRWSRRKQEADQKSPEPDQLAPEKDASQAKAASAQEAPLKADAPPEPVFDLASLPPIESIGAGTDIRQFLQKGVPLELSRAALRRAWTTDPVIRDFIEVAENQWDFASGNVPGFGPLEPSDDVRRMVAEVFGELAKPDDDESPRQVVSGPDKPQVEQQVLPTAETETKLAALDVPPTAAGETGTSDQFLQREEENIATQHNTVKSDSGLPVKRSHGGALPQ
jgi:hypothetical protein